MSTTMRVGTAWLVALVLGCRGGATPTETTDETTTTEPKTTVSDPGICNPQPVFERNQCMVCHGELAQGGLDLRPTGLEERLLGVPSRAQGCDGRFLIDAARPENSQMLRVLETDAAGTCVVTMPPPPTTMSTADVACIQEWVESFAEDAPPVDFEPTPVQAAVTRVKRLTTGTTPTADELARAEANPAELKALVREWTHTEGFEIVTGGTLNELLQIEARTTNWLQIDGKNMAAVPGRFRGMHIESVLRTMWEIIDEDRPFTEIFTTNRWAMTTAMLVTMRYTDQTPDEMADLDGTHVLVPADIDFVPDWSKAATTGVWNIPGLIEACRPDMTLTARQLLHLQWGQVDCRQMPDHRFLDDAPLVPVVDDDEDWRFVEFEFIAATEPLDEPPFYDLDAWRVHGDVVKTRLPRVGFMTTPAFLNNWETNPDNQFRVTTNQMLITALGATFSLGEPTEPPSLQGVDARHADPATDCYGCHRQLDPMRGYFAKHFGLNWRHVPEPDPYKPDPDALTPFTPSFAYGGQTAIGGGIGTMADLLASHPGVATAWTQKLCWVANGVPCFIDDPEFRRVAKAFEDSGFKYRELIVELFSSPLVSGLQATQTHPAGVAVGPQRAEHWCNTVEARGVDSCFRDEVREPLGLLPNLTVVRGKVDPVVPQELNAFAVAGLEKGCQILAVSEVGTGKAPFLVDARENALRKMVEELAGLAPGHDRSQPFYDALDAHVTEIYAKTGDLEAAMQSAYVVACSSPDAAALGL